MSSRTSDSPSHQVATFGTHQVRARARAGASAGRKLSIARASATPEPSALAIDDLAVANRLHEAGHAQPRARR